MGTGLTFKEATAKAGMLMGRLPGMPKEDTAGGCRGFEEFERVQDDILFMDGQGLRQGFSCGEWAKLGGPAPNWRNSMTNENWVLLTHGFVWHPDAFSIASKVVN